jgi:hypothetical protein
MRKTLPKGRGRNRGQKVNGVPAVRLGRFIGPGHRRPLERQQSAPGMDLIILECLVAVWP